MNQPWRKFALPATLAACSLWAIYIAVSRPDYFNNLDSLAALCFLQFLPVVMWHYRILFFPLLLAIFLWAGMFLPLNGAWTSGRWFVLAAGALIGLLIYVKERRHSFGRFHLVALVCVVTALVSASVSAYPSMTLLKAMSLLLLFLYGSTGARLAVLGRETIFFSRLLLGCEVLVYITMLAYFAFRFPIFGNPNSLGAVMGVVAVPVLLCGKFVSARPFVRRRITFALVLALSLLFSSYARAGIAAAVVSCALLCIALRQYGTLLRGAVFALLLAAFVMTTIPLHEQPSDSLSSAFVYKGHRENGILGSRRPIWDETVSSIQEHPWLGSGFGTSPTGSEVVERPESFESLREATREHGNSYLAITEWVGVAGAVPFFGLVILIAVNAGRLLREVHRNGLVCSHAMPLAGVLAAGLVHAAFEDWLFAPGYYLCVFFWAVAFIAVDFLPATAPSLTTAAQSASPWTHKLATAPLGR